MKKHIVAMVLMLSMLSTLIAGCGSDATGTPPQPSASGAQTKDVAEKAITFVLYNSTSGTRTDQAIEEIASLVSEYSDGRITAKVITAGTVGGDAETVEAISMGTLDVAILTDDALNRFTGTTGWANFPYIVSNYDEADKEYIHGWIGEEIKAAAKERNIQILGFAVSGFRNVLSSRDLTTIDDFKGLKIRCPDTPLYTRLWELFGALPVAMEGHEQPTALEQGMIDGVDNTMLGMKVFSLFDYCDHLLITQHMFSALGIGASMTFWDSLTQEDQAILEKAVSEAAEHLNQNILDDNQAMIDEGIKNGLKVTYPDEKLLSDLKAYAYQVWDELGKDYDPEIMARIKESAEK